MSVITRFAPSPTGHLHLGNIRTALFNFLYARQHHGQFILRFDDTDVSRVKKEYAASITHDLKWLGLIPDAIIKQSQRHVHYDKAVAQLKKTGRLYPCFETMQMLENMRKKQREQGRPPIYNRAALTLTSEEIQEKIVQGHTPHWRFKLHAHAYRWDDLCHGPSAYEGRHMSDPILVRENGMPVYTLTSVVDDMERGVTHVIRGVDHLSNTMVQLQLFEALRGTVLKFAHLPLILDVECKVLSKRMESHSIVRLRNTGFMPIPLLNYLEILGTNRALDYVPVTQMVKRFKIDAYARSFPKFGAHTLHKANEGYFHAMPFNEASVMFQHLSPFTAPFWALICHNVSSQQDVYLWHQIIYNDIDVKAFKHVSQNVIQAAHMLLPEPTWTPKTWSIFIGKMKGQTGLRLSSLFHELRFLLTGVNTGPHLEDLFYFMGYNHIKKRLDDASSRC